MNYFFSLNIQYASFKGDKALGCQIIHGTLPVDILLPTSHMFIS